MKGFQLRRLQLTGPSVEPVEIGFDSGLNVVSGASDTGKSYLVEVIDFMLGGGTPPRLIPESSGYDYARLLIETAERKQYELLRALDGGDFTLLETGTNEEGEVDGIKLAPRHSANSEENISTFLLHLIGLDGRKVRKNAQNELQNLSFRSLAHLSIIDEETIIKKTSPIHSGESVQKTAETSVFKLLLTGEDDSALVATKKPAIAKAELEAQISLLDQLLEEYEPELAELTDAPQELGTQFARLNAAIQSSGQLLQSTKSAFSEQEQLRRSAWQGRDALSTRRAENTALLERFNLLDQHYRSDLQRLEAIAEAGFFFVALNAGRCPLCGASAGDHNHDDVSDGSIASTRAGCEREMSKIRQLRTELTHTVSDLRTEQQKLAFQYKTADTNYKDADLKVRQTLTPAVAAARTEYTKLMEKRADVRQAQIMFDRIGDLKKKRFDAAAALSAAVRTKDERAGLPAAATQNLSDSIESLLDAWHFPHGKPVHYSEKEQDLVLGARRRGEQGKGLRALTHAAFTIGLQLTARSLGIPAVGFVVLDSPLVTFREADAEEAGLNENSRLEVKQAFYRDLATRIEYDQVIIVENEDPDDSLRPLIVSHLFTKRGDAGRVGFFAKSHEAKD